MDMSDALNIMPYAKPSTGTAIWHIFDSNDADALRRYLRDFRHNLDADSIHSQNCYLTQHDLDSLARGYGVRPWTIHQHVGEGVFIPAGCAHQVSH